MSERSPASVMRWSAARADYKLHGEPGRAEVAPELLPKQHFDIWLIVDHENEEVHADSPDLIRAAPARGRTIRNSVNTPGCVSTSIDPPVA